MSESHKESISGFHAHVYYDEESYEQASRLCDQVGDMFGVNVGHKHRQPVGPHPKWSCQITLSLEQFGEVISWLALHRDGLTVFIHAETGDVIKDHTEHTIWMGEVENLNLDILERLVAQQGHLGKPDRK